jgi:hypothetical protein
MTLRFDTITKRLAGLENVSRTALFGDAANVWSFTDYHFVDGLLVPHAFEHRIDGLPMERMRLASIAVNAPLQEELFTPPAEYAPRRTTAATPSAVRVAEGIFFIEGLGPLRSLVVDTDDGVVVVEAPLNRGVAEQAISLVEEVLPGRPIRYLVLTHHHGEHVGGIAAYVARGATIVIPPGTEDYFNAVLMAPRTFSAWLMPNPPALPATRTATPGGRRPGGAILLSRWSGASRRMPEELLDPLSGGDLSDFQRKRLSGTSDS